ncbi:MAG TPA: ankyrin repeat domain-containing protein [Blastocatellia bacterium]|jgi:ankyrin repeat protein|nr:ankyrin repeat domain-containing protein [Blastocatellia bacterium]
MIGPNGWPELRRRGAEFGKAARSSQGSSGRTGRAPGTGFGVLLLVLMLSVCARTHSREQPFNSQEARAELQRRGIEFTPKAFVASAEEKLDTELIKIFLDAGIDPNARGDSGETALMHAANSGNDAGVELLLKSGARIAQVDDKGQTALHWAAQGPFASKCVALLLDRGADPNSRTRDGVTPLMQPVIVPFLGDLGESFHMQFVDTVKILLDRGADVNAKTKDGGTTLMRAGIGGNTSIVKMLLERGADVKAINKDGKNARYYADLYHHPEIAEMIAKAGG